MLLKEMLTNLNSRAMRDKLSAIYGEDATAKQTARYEKAIRRFGELFGEDRDIFLFSVPGRTEISGNHTDHNHGAVIAGSIDLDILAVVSPIAGTKIHFKSEGFSEDTVDFGTYTAPDKAKYGTSASLIAGMVAGMREKGYAVGAFDAYSVSDVFKGSGLSSSAAFEDMIGNIENHLYNESRIDNVEIAKIAQYAENVFFGKPCGLMDQMACAVGGIISIDFKDPTQPVIEKMQIDFSAKGYRVCIVNTGGNHADLTDDYASIPAEMKSVAAEFGKSFLRDVDEKEVLASLATLRAKLGDRAVLRALHFFEENRRVALQKQALTAEDIPAFFEQVKASGKSSFCYLQNVYTSKNLTEQGLSLALAVSDILLGGKDAAWRVHGGGFAGTILVFLRKEDVESFRKEMDAIFGEGACHALVLRQYGAVCVAR